jgi:type IV pilus assembly protein PilY1
MSAAAPRRPVLQRTPSLFAALAVCGLFSAPASSQWASVAQAPLSLATNPKPNVMFILDDSGSMTRDYMPDDLNGAPTHGMLSAWCNGVAFDPNEEYPAPPKADGSSSGDSTFTAAWTDGFARTGAVSLAGSTYYVFNDSTATPRDWRYDVNGNVDTSSDTYRYCMNRSESGRFTSVTIEATSTLAQKYANWYSYYRTRQLAMRSAAGKAMRGVGAEIRLGFTRISDSTSSGSWFLGMGEFSGTQRSSFYDLLYSSSASGSTPLRRTLSRVGRYYATTGSSAPIQYTCQRAYALLTTDGYWNSDTGQVYALDGRTQIGDADAAEPRPYNGANASPTLADVAQYYYQEDLRTDLADELPPVAGDDAKGVLPDPNTRQHMNVFTLGLGLNGHLRPSDWPDLKSATGSQDLAGAHRHHQRPARKATPPTSTICGMPP